MSQIASAQITITSQATIYQGLVTPSALIIPCNADGSNPQIDFLAFTVELKAEETYVKPTIGNNNADFSSDGVNLSVVSQDDPLDNDNNENTVVIKITGLTEQKDKYFVTIPIYDGETHVEDHVVMLVKQNAAKDGYTVRLTNNNHTIPCMADGSVISYSGTECEVLVYCGIDKLTYVDSASLVTAGKFTYNLTPGTGTTAVKNSAKKTEFSITKITEDISHVDVEVILEKSSTKMVERMSLSKNKYGKDANKVRYAYKKSAKTDNNGWSPLPSTNTFIGNLTNSWLEDLPSYNRSTEVVWQTSAEFDAITGVITEDGWDPASIVGAADGDKGEDGQSGETGPSISFDGIWDATKQYTIQEAHRTVVKRVAVGATGANYYQTLLKAELGNDYPSNGLIPIGQEPQDSKYWKSFGASFTSVATGVLLAEEAQIDLLGSNKILVGKTNGWVLAGGDSSASVNGYIRSTATVGGKPKVELTSDGNIITRGGALQIEGSSLDDYLSDPSKVTPSEKYQLKKEWDAIVQEYSTIKTNYGNLSGFEDLEISYNTLYTFLFISIIDPNLTPLLANLTESSTVNKDSLNNVFASYYLNYADFNGTIQKTIEEQAESAKVTANNAVSKADAAQTSANNANNKLTTWASDNYISPTEKTGLKQQKADIMSEYTEIIADAGKYSVTTTTYTSAYDLAITAFNKYTASSPENIAVDADYANISAYYTARQTILNTIATAAKKYADDTATAAKDAAISAAATDATTKANNAQSNAQKNLANQLGFSSYNDLVANAIKGTTLITGGMINTSLIHADAIITNGLTASNISIPTPSTGSNGIRFIDENNHELIVIDKNGLAIKKGMIQLGEDEETEEEGVYMTTLTEDGKLKTKDAELENVTLSGTIRSDSWSVGADGIAQFNNVKVGSWDFDSNGITSGDQAESINVSNFVANNNYSGSIAANAATTTVNFANSSTITLTDSAKYVIKIPSTILNLDNNLTKDGKKYSKFIVSLRVMLYKGSTLFKTVSAPSISIDGTDGRNKHPKVTMEEITFADLDPGTYQVKYQVIFSRIYSESGKNVGTGRGSVVNIKISYGSTSAYYSKVTEFTILSPKLFLMQKDQDQYFRVENLESGLYISMNGNITIPAGSISGSVSTAETANKTKGTLTIGSKTFNGSTDVTYTKTDMGLGNVTNESKDTMFTSPTFTGIPKAPTATDSVSTTQLATTAFVHTRVANAINSLVGGAGEALDTLKELADALGNDPNFATTVSTELAKKLDKSGGTMTGNLTVPKVIGELQGNASTADKWKTARTLSLSGQVKGSVSIDGSGNASMTTTVVDIEHLNKRKYTYNFKTSAWFTIAKMACSAEIGSLKLRLTMRKPDSSAALSRYLISVTFIGTGQPIMVIESANHATDAENGGIYQVRAIYPKSMTSGYDFAFEMRMYNNNERIVELEVYDADQEILIYDTPQTSIYNSTYHTTITSTTYHPRGVMSPSGFRGIADGATWSQHMRFGTDMRAGENLVANDIVAFGLDSKLYKIETEGNVFPMSPIIQRCSGIYNTSSTWVDCYFIHRVNIDKIALTVLDVNKPLYAKFNKVNDTLVSAGPITQDLYPGFYYIKIGYPLTTTNFFLFFNSKPFYYDPNSLIRTMDGVGFSAERLTNARTFNVSVSGINGTAQSFNGTGNITIPVTLATLTRGSYLTGSNYNGGGAVTWAVDATSTNTASKVVARDANGSFSANVITATRINLGLDPGADNSIGAANWFKSSGNTGWYNSSYGGGIYMTESTTVKTSHNKKFRSTSTSEDALISDGGIVAEGNLKVKGKNVNFADEASIRYNSETKTIQFIFN